MCRDEIIAILRRTEPTLRNLGIAALYLFGSHARDQATDRSDIDVFVDPAPDRSFGFMPFMDACETIEEALGRPVDYGTRKGLHPALRPAIEQEAIRVF